jgi:hypothetical protein
MGIPVSYSFVDVFGPESHHLSRTGIIDVPNNVHQFVSLSVVGADLVSARVPVRSRSDRVGHNLNQICIGLRPIVLRTGMFPPNP